MPTGPLSTNPYVTAPEYVLGANNIVVFIDGVLTWNFEEVASGGATSTIVKITETFTIDANITVLRRPGVLLSPTKINATHYNVTQYNAIVSPMLKQLQPSYTDREMCTQAGYLWFDSGSGPACWELNGDAYIKLLTLNPAKTKLSPGKLIDYTENLVLHDIPVWDPARNHHAPTALHDINFQTSDDMARYSYAVDGNVNSDSDFWGDNEIGNIWLNTHDLAYVPYYDDKMFDSIDDRIKKWAMLADWATVDVFQWTKSTVHPSTFEDLVIEQATDTSIDSNKKVSGIPVSHIYERTRNSDDFSISAAEFAFTDVIMNISITGPLSGTNETQLTVADYQVEVIVDSIIHPIVIPGRQAQTYQGIIDYITEDLVSTTVTVEQLETGLRFSTQDSTISQIIVNDIDLFGSITTIQETIFALGTNVTIQSLTELVFIGMDVTNELSVGSTFTIINSTDNDAEYEVQSAVFGTDTLVTLVNPLTSTTEDGNAIVSSFVPTLDSIVTTARTDSIITLTTNPCIEYLLDHTTQPDVYVTGNNIPPEFEGGVYTVTLKGSDYVLQDSTGTEIRSSVTAPITLVEKQFPTNFVESRNLYASFVAGIDGFGFANDTIFELPGFDVCDTVDIHLNGEYVTTTVLDTNKRIDTSVIFDTTLVDTIPPASFTPAALGKTVTIIRKQATPSDLDLAFDPTIQDDGTQLIHYQKDYEYVIREVLDTNNNVIQNYYFWVADKTTRSTGKNLSLLEIKNQISFFNDPYMFYQNLLPSTRRAIDVSGNVPFADPGGPYTTNIGLDVAFDGSGSVSPSGDLNDLTFQWDFGDGFSDSVQNPIHPYTSAGVYIVTLTVQYFDTIEQTLITSSPATTTVEVNFPLPLADPGGPYAGIVNNSVIFDGTNSQTFTGNITYAWNFGDGITGVGPTPTHTYTVQGNFIITLVVNDGTNDSVPVIVNVPVAFGDPTADVGGPYTVEVNQQLQLVGAGTDPANLPLQFNWTYGDGNDGLNVGPNPVHVYTSIGVFPVSLIVDNGVTVSAPSNTTVTVTVPSPPNAVIGGTPQLEAAVGRNFGFDGSGSNDPENYPLTFSWDFQSVQFPGSNTSTLENPSFMYTSSGNFTVSLTVNNSYVNSTTVTKPVRSSLVPIADPGGPYNGDAGTSYPFDGSGSTNPSNIGTLTYMWDFGDGNSGSGVNPSHEYLVAGTYIVTLVVSNGIHDSDPITTTFEAVEPVVEILPNTTGPGNSVALSDDGLKAVIGTRGYDDTPLTDSGAVSYLQNIAGVWTEIQIVFDPTPSSFGYFGHGVALSGDGNTLAVITVSQVIIYTLIANTWTLQQIYSLSSFGTASLSNDGNTLAVTSGGDTVIYTRSGSTWSLQQTISGLTTTIEDLSSDGNLVVLGASLTGPSGAVHIYSRSAGVWSQVQQLSHPAPVSGERFGYTVSISSNGNTILAASKDDGIEGTASIFEKSGGFWIHQSTVTAPGISLGSGGCSLSGDGSVALIAGSDKAWMFQRVGAIWSTAILRRVLNGIAFRLVDLARNSVSTGTITAIVCDFAGLVASTTIYILDWSAGPNSVEINPALPQSFPSAGPTTFDIPTIEPQDPIHFLPDRYTQTIVRGLGNEIRDNEKVKLRFIQDFVLRDDYLDSDNSLNYKAQHGNSETLDLKNKHAEWVLFRQKQSGNIPEQLWTKMVEALVGFDIEAFNLGNLIPIPTPERTLYDDLHATTTRFGLGDGQAFVEQNMAKATITALLEDPSFDTYPVDKESLLANYNMNTPENTLTMLNFIYAQFSSKQVNKIWFEIFYDALTNKQRYAGIYKTSLIALQNIRLLETGDSTNE